MQQAELSDLDLKLSRQVLRAFPFAPPLPATDVKTVIQVVTFGEKSADFADEWADDEAIILETFDPDESLEEAQTYRPPVLAFIVDEMDVNQLWEYTRLLQTYHKRYPEGGTIINITALGGDFGIGQTLSRTEAATASAAATASTASTAATHGIIKSAHHEWDCPCICVDVDTLDEFIEFENLTEICVEAEDLRSELPLEVCCKQDKWFRLHLEHALISSLPGEKAPRLSSEDLVVVTGGARGVTSEVAIKLAAEYQCNLVLLGRSPLPDRSVLEHPALMNAKDEMAVKQALIQINQNQKMSPRELMAETKKVMSAKEIHTALDRMQLAGSEVHYFSCDVTDEKAVSKVIDEAQALTGKTVSGIVHGAGVLADRLIMDKTQAQLEMVYKTKVHGLDNLLDAIDESELKMAVFFASSTGRFGRKGQMDYAAANEVLNKTARWLQQENPNCKVISVNWGPWDGGMVTPELKSLFASEGVGVIPIHEGARYLIHELQSSQDNKPVEVVIIGRTDEQQREFKPAAHTGHATTSFTISPKRLPALTSHVLGGKAAVPAANMICWMMAMANGPIQNFKVLKGIHIEHEDHQQRLELTVRDGQLRLNGYFPHASAELAKNSPQLSIPTPEIFFPEPVPGAQSKGAVYQPGILFHGKLLQGIRKVTHLDETGISVIASPKHWESVHFAIEDETLDAAALFIDCAFQAAILWCQDQRGMGSLPTGFKSLNLYEAFPTFSKAMVEIKCQIQEVKAHELVMAIEFVSSEGTLIARMDGYTCVMNEALREAFEKNTLN